MNTKAVLCTISIFVFSFISSCNSDPGTRQIQVRYPVFSDETEVTVDGYTGDAMEPFITADDSLLFFNNLNDSIDTSLYYATRQSDTAFTLAGEIGGVNGEVPHLDAVASMDSSGNFYFVSTRNYPTVFENYLTGVFANGSVTGIAPVKGNVYVYSDGWIVMDAEISRNGDYLYYVNAKFSGQSVPEEAKLGIASGKDSSFNMIGDSDEILGTINDPDYLVYAPATSIDRTELYFTRLRKGTTETEICVSLRAGVDGKFGAPKKLEIRGFLCEAPTITSDGTRIYYHKKTEPGGKFRLFTMSRE